MASTGPVPEAVRWTAQYISNPRFEPYLRASGGHHGVAMKLYGWNIGISGALYEGVHVVEVMMRNAMDAPLREWNSSQGVTLCKTHHKQKRGNKTSVPAHGVSCCHHPTEQWLQHPSALLQRLLNGNGKKAARLAEKSLRGTGRTAKHDDVLAHTTFATWRFLLPDADQGRQYLWNNVLHSAFPHLDRVGGAPEKLTAATETVYLARNRIAHLEPFLKQQRVDATFEAIRAVLGTMDPRCEQWFVSRQRITPLTAQRPHLP